MAKKQTVKVAPGRTPYLREVRARLRAVIAEMLELPQVDLEWVIGRLTAKDRAVLLHEFDTMRAEMTALEAEAKARR